MKLSDLSTELRVLEAHGDLDVAVSRVHSDSRKVNAGDVFVAQEDVYHQGPDFIADAVGKGAVAVVAQRKLETDPGVPWILVPNAATALAELAAARYGHPSLKLDVVGITGTNGKTTTAHFLEAILQAEMKKPALLGTTAGARYAGKNIDTGLTTPEAPELQALLSDMVESGVDSLAMEVSSHGIALKRVAACDFTVGVLTGIGSDHLDFHENHEAYSETKVNWLLGEVAASKRSKGLVVPADDEWGQAVYGEYRGAHILTFGMEDDADIYPTQMELRPDGTTVRIVTPDGPLSLTIPVPGRHNVRNVMAAIGAAQLLGCAPIAVVEGIPRVRRIAGRFEAVPNDRDFTVLVDYAHTPDALATAISSIRELTEGRLIVVFGCGGDRDRSKRPLMGGVVAQGADTMIVTSDNPRSEEPHDIIEEILMGIPVMEHPPEVQVEPHRRAAIEMALELAGAGDVVLIAGKGHESGQTIGDTTTAFDDRLVAAEVLAS